MIRWFSDFDLVLHFLFLIYVELAIMKNVTWVPTTRLGNSFYKRGHCTFVHEPVNYGNAMLLVIHFC